MTHSGHFGHHTEHVENSETKYFLKLLNVLTANLEWKLITDQIGNYKKLLNSAHGLQTKETDKYSKNTSRRKLAMDTRIMLAMDTIGPLGYDLLGHGVLIIYIHLFVQKLTQNYNRTINKKKQKNGMNSANRNGYKLLDKK